MAKPQAKGKLDLPDWKMRRWRGKALDELDKPEERAQVHKESSRAREALKLQKLLYVTVADSSSSVFVGVISNNGSRKWMGTMPA
jgi:hypothetical protein